MSMHLRLARLVISIAGLCVAVVCAGCEEKHADSDSETNKEVGSSEYSMAYGGAGDDLPFALRASSDGSLLLGGYTEESSGDGNRDALFFKLNSHGDILWQYTMGGPNIDNIQSIAQAPDGGYLICGYTESYGAGEYDMWLIKLTSQGEIQWQKSYGGAGTEYCKSVETTSDDNYIVAGYTASWGKGADDIFVMKLDPSGNILWQRAIGTNNVESTYTIHPASDGGYLIAGHIHLLQLKDQLLLWALKLDSEGQMLWQNVYGISGFSHTTASIEASAGGHLIAAYSDMGGAGGYDILLIRINDDGILEWSNYYGGSGDDYAYAMREVSPGVFLITGGTNSAGGAGGFDMLTMTVDDSGTLTGWQRTGGPDYDISASYAIAQAANDTIFAAGKSKSWGLGGYDIWVVSHPVISLANPLPVENNITVTPASISLTPINAEITITNAVPAPTAAPIQTGTLQNSTVPAKWE